MDKKIDELLFFRRITNFYSPGAGLMHKIMVSVLQTGECMMSTDCRCSCSPRESCCGIELRKRCICWYEPVRRRPARVRRNCKCHCRICHCRICHCRIEGISLGLTDLEDRCLSTECPIVFDQVLADNCRFMGYNHETGIIEISKQGMYIIDWDVGVEKSLDSPIRFGIEVNRKIRASSTGSLTSKNLTGSALIQIDEIPTTLRLINHTGGDVQLWDLTPIAHLRIISIE